MQRVAVLVLASFVGGPLLDSRADARAQVAPGGEGVTAAQLRAEFIAAVTEQVGQLMTDWREAWEADDAEALAALYVEEAVLRPPQSSPLRGRRLVEQYAAASVPITGSVRTSFLDLDGSGRLGYAFGTWQHEPSPGSLESWTGGYALVARIEGNEWKIRSHVLFSQHGSAVPGLPAVTGSGSEFDTRSLTGNVSTARDLLARLSGAWAAGDSVRMDELVEDNVMVQLFDGSRRFGRDGAVSAMRELVEAGEGEDLRTVVADFEESGRLAYAFGQYYVRQREAQGNGLLGGPFVAVFMERGGRWRIRALIFIDE